jgi:DNA-binding response OmpR family regulator
MHALIVDDDEPSCQLLEKILKYGGHTADWTTSSGMGLSWSLMRAYNLYLLDVQMPELSGTELAFVIKQHNPTAKIILISAFPGDLYKQIAQTLEVPLLAKPYSAKNLLALASQVLLPGW